MCANSIDPSAIPPSHFSLEKSEKKGPASFPSDINLAKDTPRSQMADRKLPDPIIVRKQFQALKTALSSLFGSQNT
jgi:hypothetical protein